MACDMEVGGRLAYRRVRPDGHHEALVVQAAFAFMAESNLWPLLLILVAPFACLYLLELAGAPALST